MAGDWDSDFADLTGVFFTKRFFIPDINLLIGDLDFFGGVSVIKGISAKVLVVKPRLLVWGDECTESSKDFYSQSDKGSKGTLS